jgi:hypothetical protein
MVFNIHFMDKEVLTSHFYRQVHKIVKASLNFNIVIWNPQNRKLKQKVANLKFLNLILF